jgi:hypothetical protein
LKKILKIFGWAVGVVVLVIAAGVGYLFITFPNVGPLKSMTVQATPQRLARGAYLARHVSVCIDCHSTRNWTYFSGPPVTQTEGKGGEIFDERFGFPGSIYASNITPSALGSVSDGVLYRSLTSGVDKNGKAMFPLMPYLQVNMMSEEDILSIIAYVRTLNPVQNMVPATRLNFPMSLIVRTIPEKHTPHPDPDTSNIHEYGKYLVNAAGCAECHTKAVQGKPVPGMAFAGGFEFPFPSGQIVRSDNITPDAETGIGAWSETDFISRFKFYDTPEGRTIKAESMEYNTVMPWTMYAGMTERDLGAIYTYLRSVTPVKNKIEKFTSLSK